MNAVLEVSKESTGKIAAGANIIFDIESRYSENIDYNAATGVVTFIEPGHYMAEWWVATEIIRRGAMQFALKSSQGDTIIGNSAAKRGQLSGYGVIDVQTAGVTLSLVNISSNSVALSPGVPVTAFLLIMRTAETGPTGGRGPSGSTDPSIDAQHGKYERAGFFKRCAKMRKDS